MWEVEKRRLIFGVYFGGNANNSNASLRNANANNAPTNTNTNIAGS